MIDKNDLVERSRHIVADYQDGASVFELEKTYGVTSRWIYTILRNEGIQLKRRARRPLSPIHYHIAVIVREAAFDLALTNAEMANKLGWSFQKMSSVTQGTSELTILDLQILSTFLKRDYNELMTPKRRAYEPNGNR